MKPVLYGYWRSGAAYRLRIALNLKGVEYEQVAINLKTGEQKSQAWLAMQPQGLVPVLKYGDAMLMQSPAILEWIEESWPQPALLPSDPLERCRVRAWAAIIGCDTHPVQNLRILKAIGDDLGQGPAGMKAWAHRWTSDGLAALEALVAAHPRSTPFLHGDAPGMAEVYLLPQLVNARRWEVDLSAFPTLMAAEAACLALPAFQRATPENQPDAE
ncbi:maleylacetoacetate isomerase [uncultured Maricaulis sp.]|uniref:maleylacetoacetate isomerase n=1 Tax=uncultured Maricaulis sp. TaxID=174710 RepID=UPI0030D76F50|tara:strand:+ start:702 stop:1346 length:645 start_codon:yes stop_codon:yes gene_type:complete